MAKETANNGWICLHRAMREWQWYDDSIIKSVFIDLLFSACTEPTWFKGRKLGRGQSAISVDILAQNTGLSKPTIIKALRQLEESGEIVRTKWKFYVITTIRNYSKYQDFGQKVSKNNLPTSLPNKQLNNKNNIVDVNISRTRTREGNLVDELMSHAYLIENFCRNERITPDQCRELAEAVVGEWELTDEPQATRTRKHLLYAIRAKADAERGRLIGASDKNERLTPMIEDCKKLIADGYKADDVREFFAYWTQTANDGTQRMNFELQQAWDTRTRFIKHLTSKK